MSETDNTSRRRPPTIDLTAKEVDGEPAASAEQAAAGVTAARTPRGRFLPYAVGIVLGAIVVAAVVVGLWVGGFVPPRQTAAVPSAAPGTSATGGEISSRLEKIEQALQAPKSDKTLADETLSVRLAAAEAQAKSLSDSLAALTRRVDDVAASSQSALTQGKAAQAAAEDAKNTAKANVQPDAIEALAGRVAVLESAVKSLNTEVAQNTASANDSAVRATVAAEALRAAVERGAPYQAELAAAKTFGADAGAIAGLEPFAADGIPSAMTLGRELTALVPALQRASEPEPSKGSLLERLEAHAQRLVRITPIDAAAAPTLAGDDPSSLIGRINGYAARGDVAAALTDVARLPDPERASAASWVKRAQAREAAIAASRRIAADALAALAKPAAQ